MKFEPVSNMSTAMTLGLTIPPPFHEAQHRVVES